ncbi:hypothetical protein M2093_000027 [Breznakia sp. PH1-1]|nr:hypothetical protein [Breznakia sp. PH1-1]MDH6403183.1 hypothetical protein [Breznakia sp. PF1-11]MDH6410892.1 hypothetical protein [Breznakia sp. PFB1-11]MDH6413051.1 hypothetical protein [Breznakia sp. PFB1-14]MDH6415419.1 hypothetical protein [Breznakia sp. PFB1-4]MDH6417718.1 hypothetical protein [Breznakia sp. PFB1-12]MDH6473063.1 hypothetical protein [Breznakia sp. PFB2-30]MDH6475159.1 hypothetical protein [Breznakia sp. PFB1-19]
MIQAILRYLIDIVSLCFFIGVGYVFFTFFRISNKED